MTFVRVLMQAGNPKPAREYKMKVCATNARTSSVVMLTVPKWLPTLLVVFSLAGTVPVVLSADHEFAPGSEGTYVQSVRPFLATHCLNCHDEQTANAGLRIDVLGTKFVSAPAEEWVEVMDAINSGEMPPEDEPRPDAAKSFEVVKWIAGQLTYAEKAAREAGGQIPMRRLNRDEFTNTVRELLHLDGKLLGPIVEDLPGDGKAEGFDRLGVALFFDQTQLERTLAVAEQIAELAIVNPDEKPEMKTTRFEAEVRLRSRDGSVLGMGISHPDELERHRYDPEQRIPGGPHRYEITEDGVIFQQGGTTYSGTDFRGRIATISVDDLITEDGYYTIRLRGGGDLGTRGEPLTLSISYNFKTPQEQNWDVPFTPSLDQPGVVEATVFIPAGAPDQARKITLLYNHIHDYIVNTPTNNQLYRDTVHTALRIPKVRQTGDESEVARLEAFLKDANARAKAWKGPLREINPQHAGIKPPRLFVDWVEFEGPVKGEWPPKSHQSLLFEGDDRRDLDYAREVIERFLPRAYRRPSKPGEVDRVVELIGAEMSAGKDFHSALRVGLARILASPGFLFLSEPSAKGSRPLNDYELANRLSYFLWSTMPDAELFKLAAAGELSRPGILASQVSRMLADPKSREFVENFAGQWLQVREFGSIMPATDLYRDYDNSLEESSRLEAYAFFEEILQKNLPIMNFLDSDFVMINERLARHYEIEGVEGDELRRVSLTPRPPPGRRVWNGRSDDAAGRWHPHPAGPARGLDRREPVQ